jgi:hypothetical protein
MRRAALRLTIHASLAVMLSIVGIARAGAQAPAPSGPVTPAQAAPFLGDWTLSMQGDRGPAQFALSVRSENGKVLAEIGSDQMGKQTVTDITRSGDTLTLKYSFDYQGNPVAVAVALTLDADKLKAAMDFADGAYAISGTGVRRKIGGGH